MIKIPRIVSLAGLDQIFIGRHLLLRLSDLLVSRVYRLLGLGDFLFFFGQFCRLAGLSIAVAY